MPNDRLYREQDSFLERHMKSADLLVFESQGPCTEAIYYSPMKKANDARKSHIKEFFRLVRETEMVGEQYVGERYDDMPNNPGADLE